MTRCEICRAWETWEDAAAIAERDDAGKLTAFHVLCRDCLVESRRYARSWSPVGTELYETKQREWVVRQEALRIEVMS